MWLDLVQQGVMPRSAALISESTLVPMRSSIPEVSSVAWTSMVTGTNPGEHNVFGFTDILDGSYTLAFTSARTVKAAPFWQQPEAGRSLVMNVPQTYPAKAFAGTMVSGYVALDLAKSVYPADALPIFESAGYEIDIDMPLAWTAPDRFFVELTRILQNRAAVLHDLWAREDWQTGAFVITGTDRLNHYFWDSYQGAGQRRDQLLDFYREVDGVVGGVLDRLNDDDILFVVSDHGFETQKMTVNVNHILKEAGLLELEEGARVTPASMTAETRAFAMDPGRIYVHREGRYPKGKVPADDTSVIDEVRALFSGYRVESTPLVARIEDGRTLYSGPYAHRAPDLILIPAPTVAFSGRLQGDLLEPSYIVGKHTLENAVFLCRSRQTPQLPDPMTVVDVLPAMRRAGAFGALKADHG